jgi:hypothetical protein
MKNLTKKLSYAIYIVLACALFTSCSDGVKYPRYTLETIEYVPDSLKVEHRVWVTETIRAASQHMTGGDYEDVDVTIRQAKWTADELFGVSVIGLRKQIDENYWNDLHLKPIELSIYESNVLDSLTNER